MAGKKGIQPDHCLSSCHCTLRYIHGLPTLDAPVEEMESPAQQQHVQFNSVQAQLAKMGVRTRAPVSALYKPKALKEFTARNRTASTVG